MKILVCDDVERRGEQTQRQIKNASGHEAELLSEGSLAKEIDTLIDRARTVLEDPSGSAPDSATSVFDQSFDLVILDNNLSYLPIAGARYTAESITGYVRAFVNIPYIVSLNKNPHVDFDLRYLIGDYQTHADIALNSHHLTTPTLWSGNLAHAIDPFVPWYWPALNNAVKRRNEQIRFVSANLEEPILKSLGFPRYTSDYLSRHAKGALSPEAADVTKITFKRYFEKTCRSLPIRRDRIVLSKAVADSDTARDAVSRVVAAELDRWFRRDLMGPQDVLVDVPHLLMRMPFLLGNDANDSGRWNDAISAMAPPYGLEREIYEKHVAQARFPYTAWTKSPCFWWRSLKSNAELNKMFFGKDPQWADALFCEDISQFRLSSGDTADMPIEFAAEFEGTWNRRHVAHLRRKHYTPKSRFAK